MFEYKVLQVYFAYAELELNELAGQGWRVVGSTHQGNSRYVTYTLERKKP